MQNTSVKELMEPHLTMVRPDDTLTEASRKMKEADCGCLPVGASEEKPEGIITDRDIVIRAIAEGKDPAKTKVRDFMTGMVKTCNMNDSLTEAAEQMSANGVSRLIVTDDNNKMCGILSFGRILRNTDDTEEISEVVACATGRECGISGSASAR